MQVRIQSKAPGSALTWGSSCSSRPRVGRNRSARRRLRGRVEAGGRAAAAAEAVRSAPCAAAPGAASRPTSASSGELDPEPNLSQTARDPGFGGTATGSVHHAVTVDARSVSDINVDYRLDGGALGQSCPHRHCDRNSAQHEWTEPVQE